MPTEGTERRATGGTRAGRLPRRPPEDRRGGASPRRSREGRIGIAVGILMCRLRVTDDRALAVLSKHGQDHDVKMQRLAEDVIHTGSL